MGARTGAEYVAGLADGREVWVNGDKVDDVTAYPRFTGSVRGMAADFDDETLRPYLDHYLREAGGVNAAERARLFRAAWDLAGSSLGSRLELYERFYLGSSSRCYRIAHRAAQANEWTQVPEFFASIDDIFDDTFPVTATG